MTQEIAMVIYPQGSRWLWHITVDGVKQAQDTRRAYGTLSGAVAAARQAHIDYMARFAPVEG
jgi:hypothetical protein